MAEARHDAHEAFAGSRVRRARGPELLLAQKACSKQRLERPVSRPPQQTPPFLEWRRPATGASERAAARAAGAGVGAGSPGRARNPAGFLLLLLLSLSLLLLLLSLLL